MPSYNYGIVIDSGSSGSRIQIYRWDGARDSASAEQLASPPKITQESGWSKKTSPGVSTFADTPHKVWNGHYKDLIKFAEKIVPADKIASTPVYVLSTAGMRLIPERKRKALLAETCSSLRKHSKFLVSDCDAQIQTIDGPTEGTYGWLALNYLMGSFDNYIVENEAHSSVGFMDMGGASTQIAFVPAPAEIRQHDDDLSTVLLRSMNGETQEWRLFVETWLGFGANQARTRHINNLISLAASSHAKGSKSVVLDPCMPVGSLLTDYSYGKKTYTIKGTGDYGSCVKEIYPLLMKHLPCDDQPCLFNGIHGPKMNFDSDKFVGISEYWYTANDIFQSGGEYSFHTFNEKVKEFCESSWDTILENSRNGQYSNLPEKFLMDACFKASWVMNVLHEGFELPRLGIDVPETDESSEAKELDKVHVPFKSADSVDGKELSWTLGKMLLVASAQIPSSDNRPVGITPSFLSQKTFTEDFDSDDEREHSSVFSIYGLIAFMLLGFVIYRFGHGILHRAAGKFTRSGFRFPSAFKSGFVFMRSKLPPVAQPHVNRIITYLEAQTQEEVSMDLEEGNILTPSASRRDLSVLRTRSTINLGEDMGEDSKPVDFLHKPFFNPKTRLSPAMYLQKSESLDSLHRSVSSSSITRSKTRDLGQ